MSLNATSAAHVHSNIRSLIEESERLATDALGTVKEASAVRKALGFPCVPALSLRCGQVSLSCDAQAERQWLKFTFVKVLFWWDSVISCIFFSCMLSHSVVSDSATLWAVAHQDPQPMRFLSQEYWSGLPFLSP